MSSEYVIRKGAGADDSSFALSKLLNDWLTEFGPNGLFRTCGNCKNMATEGPATCKLYSMTPPVDIILRGCSSHDDAHEIPF